MNVQGAYMAKTTPMALVELMVLKKDIDTVIKFLGCNCDFQFQADLQENNNNAPNIAKDTLEKLQKQSAYLGFDAPPAKDAVIDTPTLQDKEQLEEFFSLCEALHTKELQLTQDYSRAKEAYKEALAFSNLKIPFSDIEHVTFLAIKVGKIPPENFDSLVMQTGDKAIVVRLGDDRSHILVASSKKGRFALDTVLKNCQFTPIQVPKDFKGVPDDILEGLNQKTLDLKYQLQDLEQERKNFSQTHEKILYHLLQVYSVASQIEYIKNCLESTQMVYRITGWTPQKECETFMKQLDELTCGRIAMKRYTPEEVPSVIAGTEKVPVKLQHGTLVASFQRMIFSYGSPVYGTIDPTPFVAMFFTLLFGIMFGDAGQGLVFFLAGLLLHLNIIKIKGWNKFGPVFMAIGVSSMLMGLLTGEFFASEKVLEPFERFVTGLFGSPRSQILPMMPQSNPTAIKRMFLFFAFTIGVGFVINTAGLLINILNSFYKKQIGQALFGKTGLLGAVLFWYLVFFGIKVGAFGKSVALYDEIILISLVVVMFFSSPLKRLAQKESPIFENGLGVGIIEGMVEILEAFSSYLSNSVSFLRVGAFALAHAVLGYIIMSMSKKASLPVGILIMVAGNAIVIVLEGMIVAIQAIRLQYYEFFSKFFNETGKEFTPFKFNVTRA